MPVDPATILYALPKPGGREAVLLRRIERDGVLGLEISLADVRPGGGYAIVRAIGIGPAILAGFAEATQEAAEWLMAGKP